MSVQTIDAIYENGMFRILVPRKIALADGQAVRLTVQVEEEVVEDEVSPILQRALHVFDGLSEEDVAEVERIALARQLCFE